MRIIIISFVIYRSGESESVTRGKLTIINDSADDDVAANTAPAAITTEDDDDVNVANPWMITKTVELGGGKLFRVLRSEHSVKIQFFKEDVKGNRVAEMPIERFVLFRRCLDEATSNMRDLQRGNDIRYKEHLGGNMFIQVNTPFQGVNLRQFKNIGDSESVNLIPDLAGIFLSRREWEEFLKTNEKMCDILPEVETTVPCSERIDHCNQEGYYTCFECCPNGEMRHWF
jgi:hypothetical protein